MISAVLDACVLYPASLRDFLLRLASAELFVPYWSENIRNEWIDSLLRKRPDLNREQLERTRREMNIYFPSSLVWGYESIIPTLQLPDPKDRHVLAVAIFAKAEYIITLNLSDFPNTILRSYHIESVSPDEFVLRLIHQNPNRVLMAVNKHRSCLLRPPKTADEYLATLEKQGLFQTVAFLREHVDDV
jgi:predicted nucleic acid-binding protein